MSFVVVTCFARPEASDFTSDTKPTDNLQIEQNYVDYTEPLELEGLVKQMLKRTSKPIDSP